jgi:Terminase small subunit
VNITIITTSENPTGQATAEFVIWVSKMPVLKCTRHEQFALLVSKGLSATKAYVSAGYSPKGAQQSAARLLTNADLCTRIRELQETLSAGTITLEISSRNARVQALQNRWDLMRQVIAERSQFYAKGVDAEDAAVPGGSTGLLVKDYKGKEADKPVYKVDTGLLAELRAHEKQAAEELEQWKTHIDVHKTVDVTPAAFALAAVCTREQLLEMKRKALALQKEPA